MFKWISILKYKDLDHMLSTFIVSDDLRNVKYTGEMKVDFQLYIGQHV